jgi:hypothetical protein
VGKGATSLAQYSLRTTRAKDGGLGESGCASIASNLCEHSETEWRGHPNGWTVGSAHLFVGAARYQPRGCRGEGGCLQPTHPRHTSNLVRMRRRRYARPFARRVHHPYLGLRWQRTRLLCEVSSTQTPGNLLKRPKEGYLVLLGWSRGYESRPTQLNSASTRKYNTNPTHQPATECVEGGTACESNAPSCRRWRWPAWCRTATRRGCGRRWCGRAAPEHLDPRRSSPHSLPRRRPTPPRAAVCQREQQQPAAWWWAWWWPTAPTHARARHDRNWLDAARRGSN